MKVKQETPVKEENSMLYSWDKTGRKYFNHFEVQLTNRKEGIQKNFKNIFTKIKDLDRSKAYFHEIDLLKYRQVLGDISKDEVAEINKLFSGRYYYTKSRAEPAKIFAWDKLLSVSWGICATSAVYGRFFKGYSLVWFYMPFAPMWMFLLYNYARQPLQDLGNAYEYLIQKRSASAEYEQNKGRLNSVFIKYEKETEQLKKFLESNNMTMYDLEADVYDRMNSGALK